MEQNKRVFKWLAITSAVLMLGSIGLVIAFMPDTPTRKLLFLLTTFLPEVVCLAIIYVAIRRPQINRKYVLRRVEGRWRWVRRVYGPDPEGLRYRAYGLVLLYLALLFVWVDVAAIWPMPDTVMTIVLLLLAIPMAILIERCESKLSKNVQSENH